ncbi:hypothetical protein Cni_G09075 [Canna indica]|uniref:Uncharacterized protein n=1 Tax=Canna indica TaxID=4628 RepID=A0AAQ3K517_9LILI|nr:hypothetical protein Cni_G09075 [Canna indica]
MAWPLATSHLRLVRRAAEDTLSTWPASALHIAFFLYISLSYPVPSTSHRAQPTPQYTVVLQVTENTSSSLLSTKKKEKMVSQVRDDEVDRREMNRRHGSFCDFNDAGVMESTKADGDDDDDGDYDCAPAA